MVGKFNGKLGRFSQEDDQSDFKNGGEWNFTPGKKNIISGKSYVTYYRLSRVIHINNTYLLFDCLVNCYHYS